MKKIFLIILGLTFSHSAYAIADFDILWESNTYTPPFYKGLALPSEGSTINLVATASGFTENSKPVPSNSLYYRWEQDGKLLANASGIGKNSISLTANSTDGSENLRVTVSNGDPGQNVLKITKHLVIDTVDPKIVVYPVTNKKEVIWNQSIKSPFSLGLNSTSIIAEPYYLAKGDGLIRFSWFYEGQPVTPDYREPNIIALVPPEGSSKINQAGIKISATSDIIRQVAEKILEVKF